MATIGSPTAEADGLVLLNGGRPGFNAGGILTLTHRITPEWLEYRGYLHGNVKSDAAAQNALFDYNSAVIDGGLGVLNGDLPVGSTYKGVVVRTVSIAAIVSSTPALTMNTPDYAQMDVEYTVPIGRATLMGGHNNSDRFFVPVTALSL